MKSEREIIEWVIGKINEYKNKNELYDTYLPFTRDMDMSLLKGIIMACLYQLNFHKLMTKTSNGEITMNDLIYILNKKLEELK